MAKEQFNWELFTRRIVIHKNIEDVFSLIATSEGLKKWFLHEAVFYTMVNETKVVNFTFPTENELYYWKWKGKDFELNGHVIKCETNTCFSFTFGSAGTVKIELEIIEESTLLLLTQQVNHGEIYDKMRQANSFAYWTFFLLNLKSVAEHGIDLREDKFQFPNLLNI